VGVDQGLRFRGSRIHLHRDRLLQREPADIGDVLTNLHRLRLFSAAHEDQPQPAIGQQRPVHVLVGTGPVGLDVLELSRRLQQRLRFDFAGETTWRARCASRRWPR
jgi:hypothetical protein